MKKVGEIETVGKIWPTQSTKKMVIPTIFAVTTFKNLKQLLWTSLRQLSLVSHNFDFKKYRDLVTLETRSDKRKDKNNWEPENMTNILFWQLKVTLLESILHSCNVYDFFTFLWFPICWSSPVYISSGTGKGVPDDHPDDNEYECGDDDRGPGMPHHPHSLIIHDH